MSEVSELDFLDELEPLVEPEQEASLDFLDELDQPTSDEITLEPGEGAAPMVEPEAYDPIGEMKAAATTFDPLFLNEPASGLGAALGYAAGSTVSDEQIDAQIAKSEQIAETLKRKGKLEHYQKVLASIQDLEDLRKESPKGAFYQGKEAHKEQEEKAFTDHPGVAATSMIASGFLTPMPGATALKAAKAKKYGKVGTALLKGAGKVLPNLDDVKKIEKLQKQINRAEKTGLTLAAKKLKKQKKLQTLLATVKEGGKMGALQGAMRGDARLLEGDVEGFVKDTLAGGAVGSGTGAALGGTMALGSALLSRTVFMQRLKDSYKLGKAGKDIDPDFIEQDTIDLATDYINNFKTKTNKYGKDIENFYKEFNDAGYALNSKQDLEKIDEVIKSMEPSTRKQYQSISDTLKDFLHGGKEHDKAVQRLEKEILSKAVKSNPVEQARIKLEKKALNEAIRKQFNTVSLDDLGQIKAKDVLPPLPSETPEVKSQTMQRIFEETTPEGTVHRTQFDAADATPFQPSSIKRTVDPTTGREVTYYKDIGSGKISAVIGDIQQASVNPEKLSVKKARELKDELDKFLGSDEVTGELRTELGHAHRKLKDGIINSIRNETDKTKIKELNKVYHSLKNIKTGTVGKTKNWDEVDSLRSMTQFILGTGGKGDRIAMDDFVKQVKQVDPKLANQIMEEITQLRNRYDIGKVSSEARDQSGLISEMRGGMVGFVNKALGTLSSLVYKGSNALGRSQRQLTLPIQKVAGKGARSLANTTLAVTEASPRQIQTLINQIQTGGQKAHQTFLRPLQKALKSNHRTKQAVLFSLSQQKAFMDMVKELSVEEPEDINP